MCVYTEIGTCVEWGRCGAVDVPSSQIHSQFQDTVQEVAVTVETAVWLP